MKLECSEAAPRTRNVAPNRKKRNEHPSEQLLEFLILHRSREIGTLATSTFIVSMFETGWNRE